MGMKRKYASHVERQRAYMIRKRLAEGRDVAKEREQDLRTRAVYALRDPQTGWCWYVGQCLNPHERLIHHLAGSSVQVDQWVASLREIGYKPDLFVLAVVQGLVAALRVEQEQITLLRIQGHPLLNRSATAHNNVVIQEGQQCKQ